MNIGTSLTVSYEWCVIYKVETEICRLKQKLKMASSNRVKSETLSLAVFVAIWLSKKKKNTWILNHKIYPRMVELIFYCNLHICVKSLKQWLHGSFSHDIKISSRIETDCNSLLFCSSYIVRITLKKFHYQKLVVKE